VNGNLNGEPTWWQRLRQVAATSEASNNLCRAHALLARWMAMTDKLPVHDLLDRIYFEGDVEARYQAAVPDAMRAGVAANLHAFMGLALTVDSGRYPSCRVFWMSWWPCAAPLNRRRRMKAPPATAATRCVSTPCMAPRDWKRRLSGCSAQTAAKVTRPLRRAAGLAAGRRRAAPFFSVRKKEERGQGARIYFDTEAALDCRENLNLLYVAMTRARQR